MQAGSTLRMTRLSHVHSIFTTDLCLSSRNIFIFPHIIGMTKLQCMKYTEHVECKEEMRNSHKSLVRKPQRQDYARLMHRWANNIKMDLKKRKCTDVNCIPLAHCREQWRDLVNTVMNIMFYKK